MLSISGRFVGNRLLPTQPIRSSSRLSSFLRDFSSIPPDISPKRRSFSSLSAVTSPTPLTAMKILGNTVVFAKNAPEKNWSEALVKVNIGGGSIGWLVGHQQLVTDLDFCSDRLVSASLDGTCRLWELDTYKQLKALSHGSVAVNCIKVQGYTLVSGTSDTTASIWDLRTFTREYVLSGHLAPIKCVAIEDNLIATGSDDKNCRIWRADSGKCIHLLRGHTEAISCLQFSAGKVVTGSLDKSCKSWNPETGELYQTFVHSAEVLALEVEDDILATVTNDRTCTVWNLKNASAPLRVLKGHARKITCMRLQGDIVVTGSEDGTLRLWNLNTGENRILRDYYCVINRLVLRGNLVVVGLEQGSISQLDLSKV